MGIEWKNSEMIAACGLVCKDCAIRKMPFDDKSAENVIGWFQNMRWLKEDEGVEEALERKMYCQGYLGPRDIHWSPECWILLCTVDEKGLKNCSECPEIPCQKLAVWSEQNDRYSAAFNRLSILSNKDAT